MKEEVLSLLEKSDIISGETLAEALGVSRAAVWKQIEALRRLGYEIDSIRNKGYRLLSKPDIPYSLEVVRDLNTKIVGRELYYFKKLSSTNLFARGLIDKKAKDGSVVVADMQTRGRGRKDRVWFSPTGGLWFSVILYPDIPPRKSMMLTMAASLAVVDGIIKITGIVPRIKWPNDVLIKGKKVCGILTEIDAEPDRINFAIIGIGLNVNNTLRADLNKYATTLKIGCDSNISRVQLLRAILKNFDEQYQKIMKCKYNDIRKSWLSFSQIIGKRVRVREGEITMDGIVNDVDEDGALILKKDEEFHRVLSGDVEVLS
jgi:BirA family transcriptional regulator, biotin operon repressor / biotin---[acetyl-CoA-carboxylase] ligase